MFIVGLGFSIAGGKGSQHIPDDDGIFVTEITPGGVSAEEGSLKVGDRLVQVNEHCMIGVTHKMATDILHLTGNHVELQYERCDTTQIQATTSGFSVFESNSISQEANRDSYAEALPHQQRTVTFQKPEGMYSSSIAIAIFCIIT